MSLPRTTTVNPDYGFTRDSKGYVDFFIDGNLNMGIELTRDGDKLRIHSERFEAEGLYAPLQLSSWAVVDFRKNMPKTQTVLDNPSCLFVCFDADFYRATLIQAGKADELVMLHYVDNPIPAGKRQHDASVAKESVGKGDINFDVYGEEYERPTGMFIPPAVPAVAPTATCKLILRGTIASLASGPHKFTWLGNWAMSAEDPLKSGFWYSFNLPTGYIGPQLTPDAVLANPLLPSNVVHQVRCLQDSPRCRLCVPCTFSFCCEAVCAASRYHCQRILPMQGQRA